MVPLLLRAAGWDDEAIYFAITVCALFSFYNHWIDASGVHVYSTRRTAKAASASPPTAAREAGIQASPDINSKRTMRS